ncbi:MAG: substrate-binding domain-containing protein [Anaerolineales bacterium]
MRNTLGFLTANIHIGAAQPLWRGVLDAAAAGDANLIGFPGGRLGVVENFESQRNILYRLINADQLDGLVSWTSALAGAATPDEVAQFHRDYHRDHRPLPIVSLASPIDDDPMVSIDGYQGMRDLIAHLVDVHHYRKIALIRGPESHPYAQERYHAFLDALKEKGLTPDLKLVAPPSSWEKGDDGMRILLEERKCVPKQDFQAVVAASDLLAIGAISVLSERGLRVPGDVAVAGFNDIEEGRLIRPPLTSVSLPFYEQGRQSVETLLAKLAGKEIPHSIVLDSTLLVRQSCGCPSQSVALAAAELVADKVSEPRHALIRAQEELVNQIVRVLRNRGIAATWAKQLIDAFRQEIDGQSQGTFRATLDSMLQRGTLDGDETAAWQSAISVLRRELLPALDAGAKLRAENLFGQARVVIGEAIQRAQIARQVQADRLNSTLRDIGQGLITTFDLEKLGRVLAERLPELGIKSCYLALFENPALSLEKVRLVLAYTDGKRLPLNSAPYPACQLIPPNLLPARRYSLLVEPLFFQTEVLGFVVFEVGPQDGGIYEVLRGHISSALKGALLFRETQEARRLAERADQIKTRLLANVSHELRTPLNVIIGHAQRLQDANALDPTPAEITKDLELIEHSAEHQLRIINDLLDLSRAEINALDLYPARLNSRALIEEAFAALAQEGGDVVWALDLPEKLPTIVADPVRVRQILLNLLSNAARFTERGQITLGAEVDSPYLHLWVSDTGAGISPELVERVYEPFFSHEGVGRRPGGIGLGLSITRHLVQLHQGRIHVESEPGRGSTFHVYLPLPGEDPHPDLGKPLAGSTLWLISTAIRPPPEIVEFARQRNLTIHPVRLTDDFEGMLLQGFPAVIACDLRETLSSDWALIRRLHNHPQLSQTPFMLFQAEPDQNGLTSLVVKPASSQALWEAIRPAMPESPTGLVLIVDDDARARQIAGEAVRKGMPGYTVRMAKDGAEGLAALVDQPPDLVILDLMMPEMDGFEVLDRMRADERARKIPVVILSSRQLALNDIKRLERHAGVTLQSKGILSEEELIAALNRSLVGTDTLPPETSALAKRTISYLHQNYTRPLARWEIAESIGVNEDYLSRVFKRELGITPWEYLNRYRVFRAKEILTSGHDSVGEVARKVGFSDAAYFSRVFRQVVGVSPGQFRER